MDDRTFDRLARAMGGALTRRSALGVLAALLAGTAALDADARRKRGKDRDDAPTTAGKRRNRKRCKPECTGNFSCVKQQCVCETALCGGACCAAGQVCQRGRCAGAGETFCHDLAEACGDGAPCCDGLQCGSGQGGGPVACWPEPGGGCVSDAECAYGHHCANGACVTDPPPSTCTPTTCAAAGAACGSIPDGCGSTLQCGSCSGAQTCGGAGTANACGCAPVSCSGGKTQDPATCACACSTGQTDCSGTCANLQTDGANCGTCGNACGAGQTCCGGTCKNLQTDNAHCGTCGTACTGTASCQAGTCVAPFGHVASFGVTKTTETLGQTDMTLKAPASVALDAAGTTAWVADTDNGRIAVWTKANGAWSHTASFGTSGTATGPTDGKLSGPWGIFVNAAGTTAWVADLSNNRVAVWTLSGGTWSHTASFGSFGSTNLGQTDGKMNFPIAVFVDAAGTTAWVSDYSNGRIVIWTLSGGTWSHTGSFGTGGTATGPTDGRLLLPRETFIDAAGTTAWVADSSNHRIAVWTLSGGAWSHTASFGTAGTTSLGQTDGKLWIPFGIAVDAAGTTAWIADNGNNRIVEWTKANGAWGHTASFGTYGASNLGQTDGKLKAPAGLIAISGTTTTTVMVADKDNNRIAIWQR